MTKFSFLGAIILSLGLILLTMPDFADARRLGGGGSFGSKPSYSKSYQKPASPSSTPSQQAAHEHAAEHSAKHAASTHGGRAGRGLSRG